MRCGVLLKDSENSSSCWATCRRDHESRVRLQPSREPDGFGSPNRASTHLGRSESCLLGQSASLHQDKFGNRRTGPFLLQRSRIRGQLLFRTADEGIVSPCSTALAVPLS